ncbi:hypothetical protein KIN20_001588 [Parelaphostrongylus tenuis]|uniref:Uncharacterized protein n=1 Tax=Parelaphostrongylus tenuis TaxID=148309 RepID=A0AAD5LWC2_PARTN|nr:hypothetical protein KIN20_001588 [Parelaphostrongylus tenuis]
MSTLQNLAMTSIRSPGNPAEKTCTRWQDTYTRLHHNIVPSVCQSRFKRVYCSAASSRDDSSRVDHTE